MNYYDNAKCSAKVIKETDFIKINVQRVKNV